MSAAPLPTPPPHDPPSRLARMARSYAFRLGAITAAGLLLRMLLLDIQPLWRDEAFTAIVVQRPLSEMLGAISRDSAPPLHYVLEWLVVQVSSAPWALRVVSALARGALVPLVAAMARRIHGDAGGLWGAALVAVMPATALSSRDARMYALAASLAMASLLLLLRAIERPVWTRWLAYAAVLGAGLWTQYFVALAVAAMIPAALWWLRPPGKVVRASLLWSAISVLTLVPWLAYAGAAQFGHAQSPFWVEPVGIKTVFGTFVQFFSGPPIDPGVPWKVATQVLQGVAVACGVVALLAMAGGRHRLDPIGRGHASISAAAGFGALLILIAVSLWHPLLDARYASVTWTPLYALAGAGLSLLTRRSAIRLLAGMLIPSVALSLEVTHPQTALLVPAIDVRLGAHTLVDASPSEYLLLLYDGDARLRSQLHIVATDVPWYWGTAAYPPGAVEPAFLDQVVSTKGRILYVSEPEDPVLSPPPGYRVSEQICAVRVCLTVYAAGG